MFSEVPFDVYRRLLSLYDTLLSDPSTKMVKKLKCSPLVRDSYIAHFIRLITFAKIWAHCSGVCSGPFSTSRFILQVLMTQ
jgi:hypothetical protein